MQISKFLVGIIFSLLASVGYSSVGMASYQVPSNVGVFPDGTLEIDFPEVFNSGCTEGGGRRMYVRVGNSQGVTEGSLMQIQSVVLAAHLARKPIKFWYDRIGTTCEGGKLVILP